MGSGWRDEDTKPSLLLDESDIEFLPSGQDARGDTPETRYFSRLGSPPVEGSLRDRSALVPDALEPGTRIDSRYHVVKQIARGTLSRLYLAAQEDVGRQVVVKVMGGGALGRDAAVALLREARLLAQLNHPGLVAIYDIGRLAAGEPYLVQEHVEGRPLAELILRMGRFDPAEAVALLGLAARALHQAHESRLVHTDLRPSHILVGDLRGGERLVKVTDFGLARVLGSNGDGPQRISQAPEYLAPEQIRGKKKIDRRADIYALGCILQEMLTGRPPFCCYDVALARKHLEEPPPRLRDVCPEAQVPEVFQDILDCALAKKARDRFATAMELNNALLAAADAAGLDPRDYAYAHLRSDGQGFLRRRAPSPHTLVRPRQTPFVSPELPCLGAADRAPSPQTPSIGPFARQGEAPPTVPRRERRLVAWLLVALVLIALLVAAITLDKELTAPNSAPLPSIPGAPVN